MSRVQVTQLDIPPGMLDLGVGQPDPELLPLEAMRTAVRHRIAQPDPLPWLAYGVEQGNGLFREVLAQQLGHEYGEPVGPNDLFITNGASQGLSMICSRLTRPGDTIFVEDPTYFLALRIFADHDLEVVGVPMDGEGMSMDALELALQRRRPRLLYTIPSFHNPTAVTLSAERRERLVALALQHGFTIVADEVYQLLHHGNPPPRPLAAWAETGAVLSLGSFSKILAPGLRLGWIQAPARELERFVHNGLLDSGGGLAPFTSSFVQSTLELGLAGEHLERLRRAYRARADALCDALRERLAGSVELRRPEGGFFVWVRLPPGIEARELLPVARRHDVGFQPGSLFSCTESSRDRIRLCFAYYDRDDLAMGVARLAGALEQLASEGHRVADEGLD